MDRLSEDVGALTVRMDSVTAGLSEANSLLRELLAPGIAAAAALRTPLRPEVPTQTPRRTTERTLREWEPAQRNLEMEDDEEEVVILVKHLMGSHVRQEHKQSRAGLSSKFLWQCFGYRLEVPTNPLSLIILLARLKNLIPPPNIDVIL